MKKFISGFVLGSMIFATIGAVAVSYVATPAGFKVMVNGKEFTSDPPAMVINDRTYLPLRAMGDALGVPVEWNAEKQQAEVGVISAASGEYSRTNPAPLNTAQTYTKESEWFEDDNYTVNICVSQMLRGAEAWKKIEEANMFNDPAPEGYEYILAKINFSVVDTKTDASVTPSEYDFDTFSSNNEEMERPSVVDPDPALSGSLYKGGKTEGWITVMVKKDDANPKLAYGLDYNGKGGVWFALYK